MEFVAPVMSILTLAAKYTISPIKNRIKYLCSHENKVQTLKDQVESLKNARERVQHSIDTARVDGEEIEHDVDKWLNTVDKISEEVEKLMQDEEQATGKCFLGFCPNLWARYKVSIKAEEEAKSVAELLEKGKFDRVSYRVAPQGITATFVKGFEAFESRKLVFNGIMEALKDDRINILGVHGMGGVGKTMLVKEVARLVEGKLFDSVVIATVTQTLDLKDIQNQIAELLGLKFEEQSMVGRALRLRERLKKEKKIVIVLDDIWARFDLEEVGIPSGDEHKGCKILLTSRELNVLSSGMNSEKNFTVGPLKKEETWTLFKKMAGDVVESCDLQPIAMELAKKCGGLPIAIATVARALRNKKLYEWKNALLELKRPSSRNLKGVATDVYSAIELSYNYLGSEEVKFTFLLCSLLGHNGSTEDLLRYVIGMGLFHGMINSIEEARNRVLTLVSNLKASCLLLDSYNDERFDIHDVVWDVALSIASRDHHMYVFRAGEELKEWPAKEIKDNCGAISFHYPSIKTELPDEMKGFDLSLFCMRNVGSLEIPANFFGGTKGLKVLDFTDMQFTSLPVSISHLINLQTLCLHNCALQDISIVGMLKNLKVLSLARSVIEALPKEIAQLSQLGSLNLSGCTKLQLIPPNVLSRLLNLEELYLDNSFVQWEGEVLGNERRNASLDELKHLSHLTTLHIYIPNTQISPKHLFIVTLERYRICIGEWEDQFSEYARTLKLKVSIHLDHAERMLLKKTEDLHLAQLKGIKHVFGELSDGEGFPHLKKLHIQNGLRVQYITKKKIEFAQLKSMTLEGLPQLISFCSEDNWCSTSHEEATATSCKPLFNKQLLFPHLESLRLSSINAKRIWHSQLSVECQCFPNLRSLIIERCGNLEYLLSPSIARSLAQLTDIKVVDCKCLREIISTEDDIEEDQNKRVICFPQLKSLKIRNLRNLIKFCSGEYNIEFPSLEKLEIERCPELKEFINEPTTEENFQHGMRALFNEKVAVPRLERMTLFHLKNVKMIFHNQLLAGSFCKLGEMKVENCDELLTIFSSKLIGVFQSLEKLRVHKCDSLDMIFEVGELNINETQNVVHSQLRELNIFRLRGLKHVWNRDPQGILSFQNLRKVCVNDCENLKNLFPVSIAKDLPHLEDLTLRYCGVEEIVVSEGEGSKEPIEFKFPRVSSFSLTNYPKRDQLKCFYRGQHTIVWPTLKKLEITDYSTLLKMVASQYLGIQEVNGSDPPQLTIGKPLLLVEKVFPMLEELRLRNISDDDISKICDGHFPVDFLQHIKALVVPTSASFLSRLFQRVYHLECLELWHCDFQDLVSSVGEDAEKPADTVTPIPSPIKKLTLRSIKSLKHMWKKDSKLGHILPTLEILEVKWCEDLINLGPSSSSFQNLTTLEVFGCNMMINLFPPSVIQNLLKLTTMRIKSCPAMTEIVANEGDDDEATDDITFSKLQCLELHGLYSLACFCPGNYGFKFPCLQELIVDRCPSLKIFSKGVLSSPQLQRVKESRYDRKGHWAGHLNTTIQHLYTENVGYRRLSHLKFSDAFPELMEIWIGRNPREILDFKSLVLLEFCNCSSLNYIFTLPMMLSLKQLYHIIVEECSMLKDVIMVEEIEEEETTESFIFPQLNSMRIESCSSLRSFYLGSRALEFPSLSRITIADCPKMSTFASSFPRDTETEYSVDGDGDPNIAPFFSNKAVCPKLSWLELSSISIQKIWPDEPQPTPLQVWELNYLTVKGCHDLKFLFPSFMLKQLAQLQYLRIWNCKMMEEVVFMEGLTERMSSMLFPKLESLHLKDLPKLSRFCFENNSFGFSRLRHLTKTNCPSLETFISKSVNVGDDHLIDQNAQPYNLEVDNSALFNERVVLPRLERLMINGMRHCRKIWPDQITVNSFPELKRIQVESCEKLLIVFPLKMMERLEKLDELQIVDCDSLEEIFGPQTVIGNESHAVATTESIVEETMTKFVFPRVSYLQLKKLPQLKRFCSRIHATEWPSLKKMEVIDCHNVQIFASDCPGSVETHVNIQVEIPNPRPLFWVNEVTFPVLEELKVTLNDTCHGQVLSTECFRKLKVLELPCIPENSTTLPHNFYQSLPNLEKLALKDASLCQIFQFEGLRDDERHAFELTQLSELRLSKLPELTHLWKEEIQPRSAFCGLKILQVLDCGKLKTLAPYLLSFNNLTTLEVSGCHGFINLITCSTAKSLMQLRRMSIIDCEKVEEITACDAIADEREGAIVFSQLRYLQLSCLPSLASFCLGNHSFNFPALGKLIVRECPKMKIFCPGDLSTPKLQQVQLTGDDEDIWRWEGDLKTTIRQLFEEMNVQISEVPEAANT